MTEKSLTMKMLKQLRLLLSITLTVCCFPCAINAEGDEGKWEEIANDDGIVVWLQEPRNEDDLRQFRGVGTVDAPIYQVFAVLHDVPRYTEWAFRCIESELLKEISPQILLIYVRLDAPWPFSDRDTVMMGRSRIIDPERLAVAAFERFDVDVKPLVDDVVRFPRLKGSYRLEAIDSERTRVTYQVEAHPGGWIPKWLRQMANEKLPMETILALRKQAKRRKGSYAEFIATLPRKAAVAPARAIPADQRVSP